MELRSNKPLEGTAKPTEKARNSSFSKKLLVEKYIYQEQTDDQRELHGDPRLALAQHIHDQHQGSDFIPSDEDSDHQSLHPAVGMGVTPDLNVSASTASDQGTLAGGSSSWPQYTRRGSASYSHGTKSDSQLHSDTSRSPWRSPSNFSWTRHTPSSSYASSYASAQSSPTSTLR